ncbi:MAG TPA: chromosome segregation protein SMC [Chitinophagales bacterium]|nr:chromosome segregation protein SMC [Chitinophagales bacterium]
MRLVSLEIKGFKSFPEKTTINFNDSITGVVGPNGCGKSNIVDAIRWVLGEQKTTMLRSEKMENIIFNGTKQRKASSLAEVALTFENDRNLLPTEYHKITISRHYFRNGDSEYKLNGISCRLKDITSLFLDTGISSDSYAIIELGMVEEILHDKDHSRRKLFEQAAGISKYKARKKETLSKLEATQLDLNRVDDLLFEIENNLKALESQARKTERYYKLKEEYRALSIELALFTLEGFKKSFAQLQQQQQQEEDKKLKIETEVSSLEATLEKEKVDNIAKEKRMIAAQKELNDFVTAIKQKENEKNIFSENLKFQKDKQLNLSSQIHKANDDLKQITSGINSLASEKNQESHTLTSMMQELEIAKQVLSNVKEDHAGIKSRLEEQTALMRGVEKEIAEVEKNITIRDVQKQNLQQEKERSTSEFTNRQQEHERLQNEMNDLRSEEQHKKQIVLELTQAGDELQQKINGAEEELEVVREELRSIHRHLDARQNEFNLTRSFIDNMEGFPESIKFLKQHPEWATNAPLLSDIISCPAEYRVAVENFLDPYLNYYVVADMNEAMNAVNLLSNASKGRANFFVLNDFEETQQKEISAPANSIAALEIVEVDTKFRKLVNYLLGGVFILKEDPDGSGGVDFGSVSKDAALISRSGKFIRSKYSVSGGQVGSFAGKRLGRIKNLESLESEIKQQQEKATRLQNRIQNLQQELLELKNSSKDSELDNAREQHNEVKNQFTTVITKIENLENFFSMHHDRMQQIDLTIETLLGEQSQFQSHHAIHSDKKKGLQQFLNELTISFNEAEKKLNESSSSFNEKNIQFVQQQNKHAAIERELEFKNQQQVTTQELIESNQNELNNTIQLISDLEQKLSVAEANIIGDYSLKEQKEKTAAEVEQVYYESRGKIHEVEEHIRAHAKNREQLEHLLNEIRDKVTELKIQLNSLKDRLNIEFKVEIEGLMEREPDPDLNPEELQQKAERIKNRIETYGEINPMAMEAYNEMKERHDFIVNQKNDLMNAKASLLQTIDEIENTAKEKFMEAFNAVKENFRGVFKSLFTQDDECDLVLESANDILESKIQIIAKPKGKRPQIIDQLSGGEKTLTAISLLFALYMYKPAPFCILDEVDAPLDDANIDKFNTIIRDFSQKSQFILVTHNKQTMSAVDVIYGITMQEEGVSKVVPVDFRSLN